MKKLFYLLMVALSCTLWCCSKSNSQIDEPDDPDNPENPTPTETTLDISTSDLVFEAKGGEKEFAIYSNTAWSIDKGSDWCTTNATEGKDNGKVTVTVEAYSGMEDRNTNLTVKAGDKTKVLTVTQKHGDAIILSKDKFDVPQEGGEITVEVKSNVEYQVSIPYSFKSWIEETPESRAVTTKSFSFTVSENETYEKREGYIIFSGNSLKDTVYVYQAQKNELVLTENTYNISSEGEDIEIELKTNIDYDVTMQPGGAASWISQITTRAVRTDKLNFHIEANTETNSRSAKIVIKDQNSDLSDTVVINQAAKGMYAGDIIFETEQDLIDFAARGDTKIIGNIIVQGSEIKTLQRLNNILTEIDGSLTLDCSSLTSLDGLYGLKTIMDSLIIKSGGMISLEGLENLQTIGGSFKVIAISSSAATSFTSLYSPSLSALKSFQGLSNLKSIGGDFEINASSNSSNSFHTSDPHLINSSDSYSLSSLESFEGLENLLTIGGDFKVIAKSSSSNSSYSSNLFHKNPSSAISLSALKSFQGLSSLKSIGGDFEVNASASASASASNYSTSSSLTSLESFEGLENLQIIGRNFKVIVTPSYSYSYLKSESLTSLKSFQGLSGLKSIGGDFEVSSLPSNISSYYSFLTSLESFKGLENLQTIGGSFKVISSHSSSLTSLKSFQGLSGLKSIGGDFEVEAHSSSSLTSLESFEGLENLQTIGGSFKVSSSSSGSSYSLTSLKSFQGLSGLKSIGGDFEVEAHSSSSSLTSLESFEGLENLQTIGGYFSCSKDISTKSLSQLYSVGGNFSIYLSSDEGLGNLVSIGGNFSPSGSSFKALNKLSCIGSFDISNFKGTSFEGLENLKTIQGGITIKSCSSLNSIDALKNVESITKISITDCRALYDFCVLKNIVQNMSGTFYVNGCGYNPTKYQLLNGECSQTPNN